MMGFLNFFGGANGVTKEKLYLYRVSVDAIDVEKNRVSSFSRTVNAPSLDTALLKSMNDMYLHSTEVVTKFSIKMLPKENLSWF